MGYQIRSYIADNIRYLRRNRGYTQTEVAELVKLSLRAYRRIEAGQNSPPMDVLQRISQLYGLSLDVLFLQDHRMFVQRVFYANQKDPAVRRLIEIYDLLPPVRRGQLVERALFMKEQEMAERAERQKKEEEI